MHGFINLRKGIYTDLGLCPWWIYTFSQVDIYIYVFICWGFKQYIIIKNWICFIVFFIKLVTLDSVSLSKDTGVQGKYYLRSIFFIKTTCGLHHVITSTFLSTLDVRILDRYLLDHEGFLSAFQFSLMSSLHSPSEREWFIQVLIICL